MPTDKHHWLELKLPPVIQVAISAGLITMSPASILAPTVSLLWSIVAVSFAIAGFAIAMLAVYQFRQQQTTFNPTAPQKASSLVDSGVFKYSRNPMYLAMLISLIGWSAWWLQPFGLIICILFCLYMTRFQILPEERALKQRFGELFEQYCQQTRRWL